jgi:hypothetical protein
MRDVCIALVAKLDFQPYRLITKCTALLLLSSSSWLYSRLLGWRKLHNEELHNLYFTQSIIRMSKSKRMRWAGLVVRMGEKRNAHRILVGKLEGKRPLGRPRRGWLDNIKMDLREIEWDGADWINMAQDRGSGGLL